MNFKIVDSKFRELLLPTLLIVMALNISSVFDTFFVGSFLGENAVAAMSLLEPIILLITVFEWFFGLGGQIIALNKKANFDTDGSNRYFTVSILLSFLASSIMAIVCLIFTEPVAMILGSSPLTKPFVIQYFPFLCGCFVVSTLAGVLTQFIRVDSQPKFAAMLIILANLVNIILDYVFLSLGMGMASASLASFIGYAIALAFCLWYVYNPKRTFRFVRCALAIKTFFKTAGKIIKVGFPAASLGFFQVVFFYILNIFLVNSLGDIGLTTYMICVDALVISSVVTVGVFETLTSIVPIYYAKHDYLNLNHLIKNSLIISLSFSALLTIFLLIWPEGFLAFYNLNKIDNAGFIINALKLYSFYFIFLVLPSLLIFYYEGIERSVFSSLLSLLSELIAPLISIFLLYDLIGSDGIWLGFSLSSIITMIVIIVAVKLIQKREGKYEGLFFIEKDLINKTKNFVLTGNDCNMREDCLNHLKNLNADDEFCGNVSKLLDVIFDTNDKDTYVEVLLIDYPDNIHVDIKYEGDNENFEQLKSNFPEDLFNYAEVLGFNTIEYSVDKT